MRLLELATNASARNRQVNDDHFIFILRCTGTIRVIAGFDSHYHTSDVLLVGA